MSSLSVEARYLEPELPIELDDAYAQTFERLRRLFRARGCSPEESADLAQDAAVRAFLHIRRWGVTGAGLDPLLNRISRNLLIDRYRRGSPHLVPLESAGELHDPDQDPSEEVARRQRRRAVRSAISELPTRHQTAITYSLDGLSPEEVGREMGIGRNAADALLHRARRGLKERLTSVGEATFGIALGFRVRWDRITRRAGLQSGLSDTSLGATANSAISVAAAAFMAVLTISGGGAGGNGGGFGSTSAVISGAKHAVSPTVVGGSASSSGASVVPPGGGGTTSVGPNAYSFGPATGTVGKNGTDNHITVPSGEDNKPDVVDLNYYLIRRPAGPPAKRVPLPNLVCNVALNPC